MNEGQQTKTSKKEHLKLFVCFPENNNHCISSSNSLTSSPYMTFIDWVAFCTNEINSLKNLKTRLTINSKGNRGKKKIQNIKQQHNSNIKLLEPTKLYILLAETEIYTKPNSLPPTQYHVNCVWKISTRTLV